MDDWLAIPSEIDTEDRQIEAEPVEKFTLDSVDLSQPRGTVADFARGHL